MKYTISEQMSIVCTNENFSLAGGVFELVELELDHVILLAERTVVSHKLVKVDAPTLLERRLLTQKTSNQSRC